MRKIVLFLFCILTTVAKASDYKLTGFILSKNDSLPLISADVYILKSDSSKANVTETNVKGEFQSKVKENYHIIEIFAKGHKPTFLNVSGDGTKDINLGKIYLDNNKDIELKGVTVLGNPVIQKVDKTIVYPQAAQVKISSGSMDLLNVLNLPGMNVNTVEQIVTIEGQTPLYQINGRPQSREQILGLKPGDILRIEYSNTPSIRYVNQGVGGVINFVLKERTVGGNLYLNTFASPVTGFLNGTASAGVNYKKSEFTLLYNNNWRDYTKRWTDRTESYIGKNSSIEQNSKGLNSPFGYLSQNINLGYTYQFDAKTMLSVMFLNGIGNQHTSINSDVSQLNANKYTNFTRESRAEYDSYSPSLDVFFSKALAKNQSIEFNIVGTLLNSDYKRNLTDRYETLGYRTDNNVDNSRWSLITEGVYRKSFKTVNLGLGVRHNQNYTKSDYTNSTHERTKMTSGDTYFYGELSGAIKKLTYNLGTGLKLYSVDNEINQKSFVRNMTTLNLLYPLTKQLKVSYRFQITPTLPSLTQLSNIIQSYDSLLQIKGNPSLNPYETIRNRFWFSYTLKNFKANLWLSHTKSFDPISAYTYYDGSKYFISEYQNQDYNEQLNTQLDFSYMNLFNHLNMNLSGGWNRFSSAGTNYQHVLYNLYWNMSMQTYYKNLSLSVSYARPQKSLSAEMITLGENNSSVMLMYRTGAFAFNAGVFYPFTKAWKAANTSLSTANPYSERIYIKDNGNMFLLGFTYQLNCGKSLKKSRKGIENADKDDGILKVQ
jgi:hypothetical protein